MINWKNEKGYRVGDIGDDYGKKQLLAKKKTKAGREEIREDNDKKTETEEEKLTIVN